MAERIIKNMQTNNPIMNNWKIVKIDDNWTNFQLVYFNDI